MRALLVSLALLFADASAQEPVRVYAAGSLRSVMTSMAQASSSAGGLPVATTFGASGLLRERLENEEAADVFASADVANAQTLYRTGRAATPIIFAHNRLCALAAPGVDVTTDTLLERMLDARVKLGTSTPKADPSGDYAWQVFEKAEQLRAGAFAALDRKALKLTGRPDSPQPPPNRSLYGVLIAEHRADIFLTYCTNAIEAAREVAGARVIAIPEALAVGARYALTVLHGAGPGAEHFVLFVMSMTGQEILARHGFTPVAAP